MTRAVEESTEMSRLKKKKSLGWLADTPDSCGVIQRDSYRMEECEERKTMKESQGETQNPVPGKEQPCTNV